MCSGNFPCVWKIHCKNIVVKVTMVLSVWKRGWHKMLIFYSKPKIDAEYICLQNNTSCLVLVDNFAIFLVFKVFDAWNSLVINWPKIYSAWPFWRRNCYRQPKSDHAGLYLIIFVIIFVNGTLTAGRCDQIDQQS